jgi:hypothetical protein
MRDYSTCSPVSTLFFAAKSPIAGLFSSLLVPRRHTAGQLRNATKQHVMLARAPGFWHDAKNLQAPLWWRNFRRQKWLVFAGSVADRWPMDKLSVTVAERPLPVHRFVPQRRLHRLLPVLLLQRAHRQHHSRGLLHKPLRLKRLQQFLQNRATLLSKFS